jgi:hypothetical protein
MGLLFLEKIAQVSGHIKIDRNPISKQNEGRTFNDQWLSITLSICSLVIIFHFPWLSKSISKISSRSFITLAAESNASSIPNISYLNTRFCFDSMSLHSKVHQLPPVYLVLITLKKRPPHRRMKVPLRSFFTGSLSFNPSLSPVYKGKYHDYDTFLGQEAAYYLRAYMEMRRNGSKTSKIPPENIQPETPLIRNQQCKRPIPLTPAAIHKLIDDLYVKAGLIPMKPIGRRFDLWIHSIRKFFRTQLASLGVQADYIEYMMGHTISSYHDIQMKGIEFLRGIYIASGFSIRPKTRTSKIDALKEIIRAWGLNPEEILTRNALAEPHRTVIDHTQLEENQIHQLSIALKQQLLKEIRVNPNEKTV